MGMNMADEVLELDELAPDEGAVIEEPVDDQLADENEQVLDDQEDIRFEDEGEAPDPIENENATIRAMRKQIEAQRRELAARPPRQSAARPTLEDSDFDEDAYSTAMQKWAMEQVATPAHDPAAELEATFNEAHGRYTKGKVAMGRADFDVAEAAVEAGLSVEQQSALLMASENNARLVYALGKSPAKLALLASFSNPIKLAAEVARLERTLTATPRKQPPPPADRLPGSSASLVTDKTLERLMSAAAKSGDRSEIARYKAEQKRAAK